MSRVITIRDKRLLGVHLVDERGKYVKASGPTVRAACNMSVSPGLRKVIGAMRGEAIEIIDERGKDS